MKKFKFIFAVVAMSLLFTSPSYVYGGSHHGRARTVRYAACTIQDCTLTSVHAHSGKYYSSHYYGDGHDYHGYCSVEDCALTGYHEHNGDYCFGHTSNDGHSYHNSGGRHH